MKQGISEDFLNNFKTAYNIVSVGDTDNCTFCNNHFTKTHINHHCCSVECTRKLNASFSKREIKIESYTLDATNVITEDFGIQGMSKKRNVNKNKKVNETVVCPVCNGEYVKQHEGQSLCGDKCKTTLIGMKK